MHTLPDTRFHVSVATISHELGAVGMLPTAASGFELHAQQLPSMQGVLLRQDAAVSVKKLKTRCFTGRPPCSGGRIAAQAPAVISDAARSGRSRGRGRVTAAILRQRTVCSSSLSGGRVSASPDSDSEPADSRQRTDVSSGSSIIVSNGAAAADSSAQDNGCGSPNPLLEASALPSNGRGSSSNGSNGAAQVRAEARVPKAANMAPLCSDQFHRSIG